MRHADLPRVSPMIVMKFGGASAHAQTIDRVAGIIRERLHERPVKMSPLANWLSPDNSRAPGARKSLAHPEASNAKPEGWVGYFPSPKWHATRTQVSGHEFTRAVKTKNILGFSPCQTNPQGLKARVLLPRTARLKSCPDTCLSHGCRFVVAAQMPIIVIKSLAFHSRPNNHPAFLHASVSPWWRLFR